MLKEKQESKEFNLLDSAVINLIVEKTKLNKEKYNLILSKTVIVYVVVIALAIASKVLDGLQTTWLMGILVISTLLLFITYLYVIEHYSKMDRDIDEVVSLLQTKTIVHHKKDK